MNQNIHDLIEQVQQDQNLRTLLVAGAGKRLVDHQDEAYEGKETDVKILSTLVKNTQIRRAVRNASEAGLKVQEKGGQFFLSQGSNVVAVCHTADEIEGFAGVFSEVAMRGNCPTCYLD